MMDRKVRIRIHEDIKNSGRMDKEYVLGQVMTYAEKPNHEKLERQYYGAIADRLIASFKDENGIRDCFAIRDNQNKTKYIDISKPMLLTKSEIEEVQNKQMKLKNKQEEVLVKVRMAHKVKTGQLTLEDFEKTLRKELQSQ